jgi:uncharacterized protein (TIGR02996 family)
VQNLWNAVWANPADDDARRILADWLVEQGDPRGEFIQLQLAPRRDEKRERALLAKHGRAWIGDALGAIVTKDIGWERGFPVRIALKPDAPALDDPALKTIEELAWAPGSEASYARLPSLRTLLKADQAALDAMSASPPPRLERIELRGYRPDMLVDRQGLLAAGPERALPALAKAKSLRILEVYNFGDAQKYFGLATLQTIRARSQFTWSNDGTVQFYLEAEREKRGWRLRLSTDGKPPRLVDYMRLFFRPAREVTKIELVGVNPRSLQKLKHWKSVKLETSKG